MVQLQEVEVGVLLQVVRLQRVLEEVVLWFEGLMMQGWLLLR